jgi:hypothetical protein
MNWHLTKLTAMNRAIANLSALIFMAFASAPAVHAEPTSIRCAEAYGREPYFVTYELETNRFVLETPIFGNFLRGEIVFANEERLELSLNAEGGKILLYYDRKDKIMLWPGLPASELRRSLLQHACASVTERTVLAVFRRREDTADPPDLDRKQAVDAFSLRCIGDGSPYFVTMDRLTRAVVLEIKTGRTLVGEIKSIAGPQISFTVSWLSFDPGDGVWDEQSGKLTWIGVPNDPTRPTKIQECTVTKVRSIMEFYPNLRH